MFDDLRREADATPYDEEDPYKMDDHQKPFLLGMTPAQRFIVVLMLLMITCLISAFALLVTEKVVLPFF
jgi:hypothetical protein